LGVLAAWFAGSRTIIASRRDYGDGLDSKDLMLLRFSNRFIKALITNSTPVKELTFKKEKYSRNKIIVMYNGIELNGKPDQYIKVKSIKSHLKIPVDSQVVGIVANLRKMKRHITLIKAAAEVIKKAPNIKFVLVGDGPLRKDLQEKARQYKIQDHMYFAGSQTDILPYLKMFDIGVNCSANEGMSNAIMEYMIYGIPSIVSFAGGNPELIENGVNGFTFKLDNHIELAEKILLILDNRELQEKFINNSQKKIQSKFSIEHMINSYDILFKRLIYDC
jgi:glycosyltransferase involved in cell wall biosynthesis